MKKILVTGADGFIGSHLVEKLLSNGSNVKAFCFYNSNGSKGWLDYLSPELQENIEFFFGDIRDPNCVRDAMSDCNVVYHLAALIAIPYSYIAPGSYVDTNIHGTLNIVQTAKDLNLERVIHTSTSETYGTAQYVPIDEIHPLVGQSPYSASKIGADQIALSFWRSFSTPVSIIRPFNTYGPRQSNRAVIPTIISQVASGSDEIKLGKLSPTRDFNYVSDTCDAFIEVATSKDTIGRVINSASNFEISIEETAKLIVEIMNSKASVVLDKNRLRPTNSEVDRLFGDNTLIKKLTNWNPKFSGKEGFKIGLEETIRWFLKDKSIYIKNPSEYLI